MKYISISYQIYTWIYVYSGISYQRERQPNCNHYCLRFQHPCSSAVAVHCAIPVSRLSVHPKLDISSWLLVGCNPQCDNGLIKHTRINSVWFNEPITATSSTSCTGLILCQVKTKTERTKNQRSNQAVVVDLDSMCVHKFQATNIVAIPSTSKHWAGCTRLSGWWLHPIPNILENNSQVCLKTNRFESTN